MQTRATGYPSQPARVIQSPSVTTSPSVSLSSTAPSVGVKASQFQAASVLRSPLSSPQVVQAGTTLSSASTRQAKVLSSQPQGSTVVAPQSVVKTSSPLVTSAQQSGAAKVISGGIVRTPAVTPVSKSVVSNATKPNTVAGPQHTQNAYEVKHKDDPQLQNLKELRKSSGLKYVSVSEALQALKSCAVDGKLTRDEFLKAYAVLLQEFNQEVPTDAVMNAVFDLFDRDGNHVVDMMEVICGVSLLCTGTEEEKIHAVFDVFDENGDGVITMDEMFKFLTSVFKVVLTPNVIAVMNSMGVSVESAEDLASVTALECFKTADLNQDGKLSVEEFKNWFYAPRNDPAFLFSPVRKLLQ